MKINKLFHWLYAFLMGLPLLSSLWLGLIWTFNENAQVPTITENVSKEVDFNQQVRNGNFSDTSYWRGMSEYVEFSVVDNKGLLVDLVGSNVGAGWQKGILQDNFNFINGHKYYFHFTVESSDITSIGLEFGPQNSYNFTTLGYHEDIYILNDTYQHVLIYANSNYSSGASFYLSNVLCVDLTQMFGAGNEPTMSNFKSWYPNNYYSYTLSEHLVIENYDSKEVLDSPTNYIWLPSFGGVGWSIENVFNNMVSGLFGLPITYGIGQTIVKLLTYWLCISLIWLIYDVIMYVPLLVHRWLDKGVLS